MGWKQTGSGSFKTYKKEPDSDIGSIIGGIIFIGIIVLVTASCAGS